MTPFDRFRSRFTSTTSEAKPRATTEDRHATPTRPHRRFLPSFVRSPGTACPCRPLGGVRPVRRRHPSAMSSTIDGGLPSRAARPPAAGKDEPPGPPEDVVRTSPFPELTMARVAEVLVETLVGPGSSGCTACRRLAQRHHRLDPAARAASPGCTSGTRRRPPSRPAPRRTSPGELAVCAGSCGPGNLHLINGLYDCHRSRVPVLAIAAQIPSAEIGSGYFQETHPEHLFRECSHYCELVSQPEQMPRVLEIAMQTASRGAASRSSSSPATSRCATAAELAPARTFPSRPPRVRPADDDSSAGRRCSMRRSESRFSAARAAPARTPS